MPTASTPAADDYRFSDHPEYVAAVRQALADDRGAALRHADHPAPRRQRPVRADCEGRPPLIAPEACRAYADAAEQAVRQRGWRRKPRALSWKLTALGSQALITAALLAHEEAEDWDQAIVLGGCEVAEDRPHDWRLEAWLAREPGEAELAAIAALFAGEAPPRSTSSNCPRPTGSPQASRAWSRSAPAASTSARPTIPPQHPAAIDFVIPASQAFGTGQHATTAGCLEMLSAMKARGVIGDELRRRRHRHRPARLRRAARCGRARC